MQTATAFTAVVLILVSVSFFFIFSLIKELYKRSRELKSRCDKLAEQIKDLPQPVQNVIHLGIKPEEVKVGIEPIKMSVNPEDFKINADRLHELLVENYMEVGKRQKDNVEIWSYCILANAGVEKIIDYDSLKEIRQSLIRLLINGDDNAMKRFLRILADSVAATTTAVSPATSSAN